MVYENLVGIKCKLKYYKLEVCKLERGPISNI
uniref:Uncharacterized protein n=1 Tax=Rhizophora mucronata TaxID=61149 RepID=A0A2P2P451_RHIMU